MTRKTILKLATLLGCGILAIAINGCKESESDKAAKEASDAISNGNRQIKASTDTVQLTQDELNNIANIPDDASNAQLKMEREQIAKQLAARLSNALGEHRGFDEINGEINNLSNASIETQEDFATICDKLVAITNELIKLNTSEIEAVAKEQTRRMNAALAELNTAKAKVSSASTENDRRNTLQSAVALSFATIYSSQARYAQEELLIADMDLHVILMSLNKLVQDVRQANLDILEANTSRPTEAIEGLKVQLAEARSVLADDKTKLIAAKAEYTKYQEQFDENMKIVLEYREKYNQALSQAGDAEGTDKYKLEMEAALQKVGKETFKEWASKMLADGKDVEMENYANSSQDIIGGIYYETQAELAKLQMDSLETQINYFETLIKNSEARITQLDSYIAKLQNARENNEEIEEQITLANGTKRGKVSDIDKTLKLLADFEARHRQATDNVAELYSKAIDNLEQYANYTRGFGEFDPENFKSLAVQDLNMLHESDAEFYNSALTVLDNVRSLEEMAEKALQYSDDFKVKAQSASAAIIAEESEQSEEDAEF